MKLVRPFTILRHQVSSAEHLHEAVGVLCSCDALQPQVRDLPSVLAYLRLHLADGLLQRHSCFDLQEAQLGLQSGKLRLGCHQAEFSRRHLDLLHGVEEHGDVLDVRSAPLFRTAPSFP